ENSAALDFQGSQRNARVQKASRARMCSAIQLQNFFRFDARVRLGGRQRFVSEQVLNRTQVAAVGEQMCGECVPQSVWRGARGQAQTSAQTLHQVLRHAWREGAAAGRAKERGILGERVRAELGV